MSPKKPLFQVNDTTARTRRRVGRPRTLDMETIVAAAEALIRAESVDKLSMRSLAARLGVKAPSLYTYFSDLDEIEALALDRIVADICVPDLQRPEPLAEQLVDLFVALRGLVRSAAATLDPAPGSLTWRWNIRCFNQLLKFYYSMGADRDGALFAHRMLWAVTLDSVFRNDIETTAQYIKRDRAELAQMEKMPADEAQLVMDIYLHRPTFAQPGEAGLRERLRMVIAQFLPGAIAGQPSRLRSMGQKPR